MKSILAEAKALQTAIINDAAICTPRPRPEPTCRTREAMSRSACAKWVISPRELAGGIVRRNHRQADRPLHPAACGYGRAARHRADRPALPLGERLDARLRPRYVRGNASRRRSCFAATRTSSTARQAWSFSRTRRALLKRSHAESGRTARSCAAGRLRAPCQFGHAVRECSAVRASFMSGLHAVPRHGVRHRLSRRDAETGVDRINIAAHIILRFRS